MPTTAAVLTSLVEQFETDAEMHRASAERALRELIRDAQLALDRIASQSDGPTVRQTVGGSILNSQRFDDAERALVRFWDAAGTAATIAREATR